MNDQEPAREPDEALRQLLAAAVGEENADAALAAYEEAAIQGLCHEGALEVALGAVDRPTTVDRRPWTD
ncbi:MAG TPA: acetyltransferase [Rhodothermales bacterium]